LDYEGGFLNDPPSVAATRLYQGVSVLKVSLEEIERERSKNGGYSKATLLKWGVDYPPKKGWLKALTNGTPQPKRMKKTKKRKQHSTRKSDGFYSSWEWKKLRYRVIHAYGKRCQSCGWQPSDTPHGRLVVDHIKPRSRFPKLELDFDNMQVLCNDCNMGKSNVYEDDFREIGDAFNRMT